MENDAANLFPPPPDLTDLKERCMVNRDFRPVLFEWYKYVGVLCNRTACIAPVSPGFRPIPPVHYAVLIGLLNRCSRLMVANARLSCTKRYGETTQLLDRCIAESVIKIQWLCHKDDPDNYIRYLADGLKKDLELSDHIEENIKKRAGKTMAIETRMRASISKCINLSGITAGNVREAKRLPDLASMCRDLGLDDLFYTVVQRMGSHAVHGTWSDLVGNYLCHDDQHGFRPRDHDVDTQDVQFIIVCRLVLAALGRFLTHLANDPVEVQNIIAFFRRIGDELDVLQDLAWSTDFDIE